MCRLLGLDEFIGAIWCIDEDVDTDDELEGDMVEFGLVFGAMLFEELLDEID